jgi:signal transduction histidine kinase
VLRPEDIPTALAPFGQIGEGGNRSRQGAGLGLPLAVKLAELHDGSLAIHSALHLGTTVTIRFPPDRVPAAAAWDVAGNGLGEKVMPKPR